MIGLKHIRIYHECEIENPSRGHEACRVMTNGDREEQIFLSHPHTNNGFFFLLTTKRLSENPEYAQMQHGDKITLQ